MRKIYYITGFLVCLILATNAQTFDKQKLDNYFTALEHHDKFMGSVAVSRKGNIIYTRSVGFADVGRQTKANEKTGYRIGSISKTFTTVLALKAAEEKKLDLEQTIDRFFPDLKNAGKITIFHLLSHRSGIHSFTSNPDYLAWHTEAKSEEEMTAIITQGGSDFEPGTKAAYSNSNFVLLSYILEKTWGKSYGALVTQYIAQPLGLKNTYLGGKAGSQPGESLSYRFSGTAWQKEAETDISIPLGAGGILSTPTDLVTFSEALFNGKLLKKESLERMKTVQDGYGLGLFQIPFYEHGGYGHTGGIDGFTAVFSHFEDGDISYALTSNGSQMNANDISIAVLSAVYNKPYDIPDFKTYAVTTEELASYTGMYSSDQLPLKITISHNDEVLVAQATGQPSFNLEPAGKNRFKFDQAGIIMEFQPEEHTMTLKQGGGSYSFRKDK